MRGLLASAAMLYGGCRRGEPAGAAMLYYRRMRGGGR